MSRRRYWRLATEPEPPPPPLDWSEDAETRENTTTPDGFPDGFHDTLPDAYWRD